MASLAVLIARCNVLENIYRERPGMTIDSKLETSLVEMCVLVLLYLHRLANCGIHGAYESAAGEADMLQGLDELVMGIEKGDDECRDYTIGVWEERLLGMDAGLGLVEEDSDENGDEGEEEEREKVDVERGSPRQRIARR